MNLPNKRVNLSLEDSPSISSMKKNNIDRIANYFQIFLFTSLLTNV